METSGADITRHKKLTPKMNTNKRLVPMARIKRHTIKQRTILNTPRVPNDLVNSNSLIAEADSSEKLLTYRESSKTFKLKLIIM